MLLLKEQAGEVYNRFLAKGYNKKTLDQSLIKVRNIDRKSSFKSSGRSSKSPGLVCATTFSNITVDLKNCVRKHWYILKSDPQVGHVFQETPVFAQKRAPNLSDKLVRADCCVRPQHFLSSLPKGNFSCHNCVQCDAIIRGEYFSHPHSGRKFPVKSRISCRTKFVVYLLQCPCGLCYVGKTKRELRIRISEHKSGIRNFDEKSSVARHFNSAGHDVCSLRFQGIEEVKPLKRGGDREKALLQREAFWIHTLQTEYPKGMDEELLLGCFL